MGVRPIASLTSKIVLGAWLVFSTLGCKGSLSAKSQSSLSSASLSGKVIPFATIANLNSGNGAAAVSSCTNATVALYALDSTDKMSDVSIASTSMNSDGSYSFSGLSPQQFSLSSGHVQYVVQVQGCGDVYLRPVTGSTNQDVSDSSTLLALVATLNSTGRSLISGLDTNDVGAVLTTLSASDQPSLVGTYQNLVATPALSSAFLSLTKIPPTQLLQAPPLTLTASGPTELHEVANNTFSVSATVWNPSVALAYAWILDGQVVATGSNSWVYQTSANSQGSHSLVVQAGLDNGSGAIDTTKPVRSKTIALNVQNDYPALAPAINVSGGQFTNQSSISLTINTGNNLSNCATFSSMAVTTSAFVPPVDPNSFNMICTSGPTQIADFLLPTSFSAGTLALWVMDSAGNVSSLPSTTRIQVDSSGPKLQLGALAGTTIQGGHSLNINYSASDTGSGVASLQLFFSGDGSAFSLVSDLTNSSSPYVWTAPTIDSSVAVFKLVASDGAGNTSTVLSDAFSVESTAPVVTILSPSAMTATQSVITVAGACNPRWPVGLSGDLASVQVMCTSLGQYSQAVVLTGADGTKSVSVTQTNDVGESTTVSRQFLKVTTPPLLIFTSTPNAVTNQLTANFVLSATPSGQAQIASFQCNEDGVGWSQCSSATSFAVAVGSHTFQARAVDTAGNVSNVQSFSWSVTTTLPVVTLTSKPSALTSSTSASFGFSVSTSGGALLSSYQCKLDSGAFATCANPWNSVAALASGAHTFQVTATDTAGNVSLPQTYSWTIVTAGPTTTISSSPSALTNSSFALFSFTAVPSGGTSLVSFQCQLDANPYASCLSPTNLTNLAPGSHAFNVRAIDSLQNIGTAASFNWIIDTTSPLVTLSSTPSALTNSTSASFNFSATDALSAVTAFTCVLDGVSVANCSSPRNFTGLTQGVHSFSVAAADQIGNVSAASSYTWTIDTTAPTVNLTSVPPAITNSPTANLVFIGSDTGGGTVASFQCSMNGSAFTNCTSPKVYSGLSNGSQSFSVRAVDSAGNTGTSVTASWVVDSVTPMAVVTGNPPALTNSTSASFSFSANPPAGGSIVGYQCKIDSAATWSPCSTGTQTYSGLAAGSHLFQVQSVDNLGGLSSPTSYSWVINLTPPAVTIASTSEPSSLTNLTSAAFAFTAAASNGATIAGFKCSLNGAAFTTCSSPQSYSALAQGSTSFAVQATDSSGNVSAPASYTWTIDLTGPTTTLLTSPALQTNSTSATFAFSASASLGATVATYICQLDSAVSTTCSSSKVYNALGAGTHSFRVYAIDSIGNVGSPVTFVWNIDLTPPALKFVATPLAVTNLTSATFSFSATDSSGGSVVGFQCQLDGGGYSTCSTGKTYSNLSAGTHTVNVTASDSAGNTSAPLAYTWYVDTSLPIASITTGPQALGNSASAIFSFAATLPSAAVTAGVSIQGFQCKVDAGAYSSCANPVSLSGLAQGAHSFYVVALDSAGNSSLAATFGWTVDLTPPVLNLTSKPSANANSTTATFAFSGSASLGAVISSYQCTLDAGASGACTSPITYNSLAQGAHTFKVTATDSAGNVSASTLAPWTVDTIAPVVTLSSTPASWTNSTSARFAFSATDSGVGVAGYQCQLDGGTSANCTSPWTLSGLSAGSHSVAIVASDSAGNVSPAKAYSWTINLTAPSLTITTQPAALTNATTASLAFSGSAANGTVISSYMCGLDSNPAVTCASPNVYSNLASGPHTFNVTATDSSGNTSSSAIANWTIDTTPPTLTITSGPAASTTLTTASFVFSATASGAQISSYQCKLDSAAAYTTCSSPLSYSGLSQGGHSLSVTATDSAGNVSATQTYAWTIGSAPPSGPTCASTLWVQSGATGTQNGSASTPYSTISNAISHATSGACILIHGGVYLESVYVSASNLTLMSAPGEEVVVSGFKPISGWTASQTNGATTIYETTLNWKPYNFFVGYSPKQLSHFPSESWFSVPQVASSGTTSTTITDAAHLANIPSLVGASAEIWVRSSNTTPSYKITNHDTVAGTITMAYVSGSAVGDHYLVTNSPSFLQAGQWAVVDSASGSYQVYYATTTPSEVSTTQASNPAGGNLVQILGSGNDLNGLVVVGANSAGVSLGGSNNTVENMIVIQNNGIGVSLRTGTNLTVKHNVIYANGTGMAVIDTSQSLITENEIAFSVGDALDIYTQTSTSNQVTISKNYIHHHLNEVVHSDGCQVWGNVTNLSFDSNVTMFGTQLFFTEGVEHGSIGNVSNVSLTNNIIADSGSYPILSGARGGSYLISGNTIPLVAYGAYNITNSFVSAAFTVINNVYDSIYTESNKFAPASVASDNNLFHSSTTGGAISQQWVYNLTTNLQTAYDSYSTLSALQTGTGMDLHSAQVNSSQSVFVSMPKSQSVTDLNYLLSDTTTTLILRSASTFAVGDTIEINMDGVVRKITAISGNTITFDVPLSHKPFSAQTIVDDWGGNPSSFNRDATLAPGSVGLTLSNTGGAVGSSASIGDYQAGKFGNSARVLPNLPADFAPALPSAYGNEVYFY